MKKAKEYSEKLLFLLDINAELTELDIQRAYVAGYNQAIEDAVKNCFTIDASDSSHDTAEAIQEAILKLKEPPR